MMLLVSQGIPILERVPIPEEMVPEDGQVEIQAKVHAGYFAGHPGEAAKRWNNELDEVNGRGWDDIDVLLSNSLTNYTALMIKFKFSQVHVGNDNVDQNLLLDSVCVNVAVTTPR
jgi:hypothetical protein